MLFGLLVPATPASAVGSYDNATIADIALSKIGQNGGQCKPFVNNMVSQASGGTQWPAPGYHTGFQNAGGVPVSSSSATKGDIIQVGEGLHTAIIVENLGGGNFKVVDSNWTNGGQNPPETVSVHNFNPYTWMPGADTRIWRMGTVGGSSSVEPEPDLPGLPTGDLWAHASYRTPGGMQLRGWAVDRDTSASIDVHFYGGTGIATSDNPMTGVYANLYHQPVDDAYPGVGPYHGFDAYFPLPHGDHHICAYGINAPGTIGYNRRFDCIDVSISPHPFGNLESVQVVSGGIVVRGWTIDPDTATPTDVHVYADSTFIGGSAANQERVDVGTTWTSYGNNHGYEFFVPLASGSHTVCAHALNVSGTQGSNQLTNCLSVVI